MFYIKYSTDIVRAYSATWNFSQNVWELPYYEFSYNDSFEVTGVVESQTSHNLGKDRVNLEARVVLGSVQIEGPRLEYYFDNESNVKTAFIVKVTENTGGYHLSGGMHLFTKPSTDVVLKTDIAYNPEITTFSGTVTVEVDETWTPVVWMDDVPADSVAVRYKLHRKGLPTWSVTISVDSYQGTFTSSNPGSGLLGFATDPWPTSSLIGAGIHPESLTDIYLHPKVTISDKDANTSSPASIFVTSNAPISIPSGCVTDTDGAAVTWSEAGTGFSISAVAKCGGNPYYSTFNPGEINYNLNALTEGSTNLNFYIHEAPYKARVGASTKNIKGEELGSELCVKIRPNDSWDWVDADGELEFNLHGCYTIVASGISRLVTGTGAADIINNLKFTSHVVTDDKADYSLEDAAFGLDTTDTIDWSQGFLSTGKNGISRYHFAPVDPLESPVDAVYVTPKSAFSICALLPHTYSASGVSQFSVLTKSYLGKKYRGRYLRINTSKSGTVSYLKLIYELPSGRKFYWDIATSGDTTLDLLSPKWTGTESDTDYFTSNSVPIWIGGNLTFEASLGSASSVSINTLSFTGRDVSVSKVDSGLFASVIDEMPGPWVSGASTTLSEAASAVGILDGVEGSVVTAVVNNDTAIIDSMWSGTAVSSYDGYTDPNSSVPLNSASTLSRKTGSNWLKSSGIIPGIVALPGSIQASVPIDTTDYWMFGPNFSNWDMWLEYRICNYHSAGVIARKVPVGTGTGVIIDVENTSYSPVVSGLEAVVSLTTDNMYGTLETNEAISASGSYFTDPLTIIHAALIVNPPPGEEDPYSPPEDDIVSEATTLPGTPEEPATPSTGVPVVPEVYAVICDTNSHFMKLYTLPEGLYAGAIRVSGDAYPVMVSRDKEGALYALLDEAPPTRVVKLTSETDQELRVVAGDAYSKVYSAKLLNEKLWVMAVADTGDVIITRYSKTFDKELMINTGWSAADPDEFGGALSSDSEGIMYAAFSRHAESPDTSSPNFLKLSKFLPDGTGFSSIVNEVYLTDSFPGPVSMEVVYDEIYVGLGHVTYELLSQGASCAHTPWIRYSLKGEKLASLGSFFGNDLAFTRSGVGAFGFSGQAYLLKGVTTPFVSPYNAAAVFSPGGSGAVGGIIRMVSSALYSKYWPGHPNWCTSLYGPNGHTKTDTSVAIFEKDEAREFVKVFRESAISTKDTMYRKVLSSLSYTPQLAKNSAMTALSNSLPTSFIVEDDCYLWKTDIQITAEEPTDIEVRAGVTTVRPRRARSAFDFFNSSDPVWYPEGFIEKQNGTYAGLDYIYMRNLEVVTTTLYSTGGLTAIAESSSFVPDAAIWYETPARPSAGIPGEFHWRLISSGKAESGGVVYVEFPYTGSINVRYRHLGLMQALKSSGTVSISGRLERKLYKLWYKNKLDRFAEFLGITRLNEESNSSLIERILNISLLPKGTTSGSMPYLIANELGLVHTLSFDVSDSETVLTLPAGTIAVNVIGLTRTLPVKEQLTKVKIDDNILYIGSKKCWDSAYNISVGGTYTYVSGVDTAAGIVSGIDTDAEVHAAYTALNYTHEYDGPYISVIKSIPGVTPKGTYKVFAVSGLKAGSPGDPGYFGSLLTQSGKASAFLYRLASLMHEAVPILTGHARWGKDVWFEEGSVLPALESLPILFDNES